MQESSLLILNGRTPGDEAGKYTFGIASSSGHSAIDYIIASAQCMSAAVFLQVNEDAEVYCTDHHSVILHMVCEPLKEYENNSSHFSTVERVRYDDQKADAYEEYLTAVLHSQWMPLLSQNADVDMLSKSLADLALEAARETTPQACKRRGNAAYVSKPWYDETCKSAYRDMKRVLQCSDSTAADKQSVQKQYKSVTCRAKRAWMQQRNAELMHLSSKDPKAFWKAYNTRPTSVLYACRSKLRLSRSFMAPSFLSPLKGRPPRIRRHPVSTVRSACLLISLLMNCRIVSKGHSVERALALMVCVQE